MMDKILRRDLLSPHISDKEVMYKHNIATYRGLRRLYMMAIGIKLKGGTYGTGQIKD